MDFSRFNAFFDSYGVIFYQGETEQEETVPLNAPRMDTGNNPYEDTTGSGNRFAQGQFHGGQGQRFFHRSEANPAGFLRSEGLRFERGKITNVFREQNAGLPSTPRAAGFGKMAQADETLFVAYTTALVGKTTDLSTVNTENVHAGEGTTNIYDITSAGDWVIAALGTNGIHFRDAGGTWAHIEITGGSTDIDTGDTRVVEWLRNRLLVAGGVAGGATAGGRVVYECILDSVGDAAAAPTVLLTLPSGWLVKDFFELGSYIYAVAHSAEDGASKLFTFGINSAGTALEVKGSTALPTHELAWTGIGYLGRAFIGAGRRTTAAGYDPVLYQGIQGEDGSLQLILVAEEEGAGTVDCSVKAIEPDGKQIILGWCVGTGNPYGSRVKAIARYDLANDAFFHASYGSLGSGSGDIVDLSRYKGKIVWSSNALNLTYEDPGQGQYATAHLITSIADFNNAGLKTWREIEVLHTPMPANASLQVYYTTTDPEEDSWTLAGTSNTASATGKTFTLTNVTSRLFALKFVMNSNAVATPEAPSLISFSVRSDPSPATAEWRLTRFLRIREKDRASDQAQAVVRDVRESVETIRNLIYDWVTFSEPGVTWNVRVESVARIEPQQPVYSVTGGEKRKERTVMRVVMQGTKS